MNLRYQILPFIYLPANSETLIGTTTLDMFFFKKKLHCIGYFMCSLWNCSCMKEQLFYVSLCSEKTAYELKFKSQTSVKHCALC